MCCEGSDNDGGKVYTVKGTTSGYAEGSCQTYTDKCVLGKLAEHYIEDKQINFEIYDCSQRADGLKHCVDGKCGCLYDSDCKDANGNWRYDPVSHTKIVCDSPSGSYQPRENTYTCRALGSCRTADDCEDTWCCTSEILPPSDSDYGKCWQRGIYTNNPKYLCDPPDGFDLSNKKLSLFGFLTNPFSKVFS